MSRLPGIVFLVCICFSLFSFDGQKDSPVKGKTICIDPGHGGTALTDSYRVGPSGEREEWINLRVALLMQQMLEEKGAKVVMTRTKDIFVPLTDRAGISREQRADIFISIHHNATADSSVNFPIIYFHGNASENRASVLFGKILAQELVSKMFKGRVSAAGNFISLVSDHTIFPDAGASVLRHTYGTPAVLAEASFFTNPGEEQLLKSEAHNRSEALAYVAALETFFETPAPSIAPKNSEVPVIPPFKAFQEAERMTPVARRWKEDFLEAEQLLSKGDTASAARAFELFTRSARSFPDSYVAARCHQYRSVLLEKLGKTEETRQEAQRAAEYYVHVPER